MPNVIVKQKEKIVVKVGRATPGPPGPGVPVGGTTGQILRKASDGNTDTTWSSAAPDTEKVGGQDAATVLSRIAAVESGQASGVYGYATKALMDADLTPPDKAIAYVTNDATAANNGTYRKSGGTGTGSWVQSSSDRVALVEASAAANAAAIETIETKTDLLLPQAPAGYAWALVDAAGLAAAGLKENGTFVAGRMEADEFQTTVVEAETIELGEDITRNSVPVGWAWLLVGDDGLAAGGVRDDGTLAFAAMETKDLATETINDKPTAWLPDYEFAGNYGSDIAHIISYGQSLSIGNGASSALTTTQVYDSLMFTAGVRAQEGAGTVAENHAAFVPLVEVLNGATGNGETPIGNAAATIKRLIAAENLLAHTQHSYQLLGSAPGVSNNSIALLSKGGGAGYTNLINDVTYGLANALALNKTYSVPSVFWSQGERDYTDGTSYAAYLAAFLQLYADLNTDIKALTGQPNDIKIIGYQCLTSTVPSTVALAQRQASKNNPNIFLACPVYCVEHLAGGNVHLSDHGYATLGAYYGLVHKRVVIDGGSWSPLQPVSTFRQGAVVLIKFHVPVRPLALDSVLQPAVANSGFSLVDGGGADISIASVAVSGPDTVRIVASVPLAAGSKVRYGFLARPDGIRAGNLRDSQGSTLDNGIVTSPVPLHNWCIAFEETLA
jgi:hypothetical protein